MKKYLTPKTLLIFGIITLITLVATMFLTSKQSRLAVVTSAPPLNTKDVRLGQKIILNFNQGIEASTLKIQSNPDENWEIDNEDPDTIILSHKLAFHPSTEYTLSVFSEDKLIYSLTFTTEKSQGDIRLIQTIEEKMKIDYPLSKQLPYKTLGYEVVYSAPLTLEITLKNPNLTSVEVISEVKAWVTDNGGDASAHKYVFAP